MHGGVDTSPGRPFLPGPSRCMGCALWMEHGHDCGGDKIYLEGLDWWCDCDEPACRQRQQGVWTADPPPTARTRKREKPPPTER